MKIRIFFALALLASSAVAHADVVVTPKDQIEQPGLPPIGKWLISPNGAIAHWLGARYDGQTLDEPINVIIRVDQPSAEAAQKRLMEVAAAAGFSPKNGHSSGYLAYLNQERVAQFPNLDRYAFSDEFYLFSNNHGRIFGPVLWNDRYYFVGAFSRETVALGEKILGYLEDKYVLLHPYSSFNVARDRFVKQMCQLGGAVEAGRVDMENRIGDDPQQSTGDHDGYAVLLDL